LTEHLAALGVVIVTVPLIEVHPPESWAALDAALADWARFEAVVFTSANGVHTFFAHVAEVTKTVPERPPLVCAIGPATAAALTETGWTADLLPPTFVAESLAETLARRLSPGAWVLVPRAARAREVLEQELAARGMHVVVAPVYQTAIPAAAGAALAQVFAEAAPAPYAVIFTSASTVQHFSELLRTQFGGTWRERLQAVHAVAIGPITARAIAAQGLQVAAEAEQASVPALVAALQGVAAREARPAHG